MLVTYSQETCTRMLILFKSESCTSRFPPETCTSVFFLVQVSCTEYNAALLCAKSSMYVTKTEKSDWSAAWFRIDLTYCFEDIENSTFLTFGLKSPNHAHFWGVLWDFDTMNNFFSHRNRQKAHPWVKPRRLRNRSWKSVHPFLL